jgi:peptidoglycan/xylan/chitin deacetylase (PgdA/CDA1 family)
MNAEIRARTLRTAYLRMLVALLPLILVFWLVWHGHTAAAVTIFVSVLATMMTGTLVPRCTLFGPMIKELPPGSNHALLTIDDGPHPQHTPAILDILDRHGLKAVFFLVGERAARHPDLVREIIARGHEIGNHTQTHPAAFFLGVAPGPPLAGDRHLPGNAHRPRPGATAAFFSARPPAITMSSCP